MKKVLLICVAALAAVAIRADYLVWQVKDTGVQFNYAQLYYTTGANEAAQNGTRVTTGNGYVYSETAITSVGKTVADLGGTTTGLDITGFYVELYSYAGSQYVKQAVSDWMSLSAASSAIQSVADGGKTISTDSAVATFEANGSIPEPTSGLLLLLGLSALALRRKIA